MQDAKAAKVTLAGGSAMLAAAILAGAFGAHLLEGRLSEREAALWETAARYLAYGGLALLALGAAATAGGQRLRVVRWAAPSLAAGTLVFATTVALLALGGPSWLGAITPVGGLLMVVGLCYCAAGLLR
jgi:uncharacterized membrane protein YgdD (TMEM256/DUF423 family)